MDADVFAMDVFGEERSTKVGPEDISTFENNKLTELERDFAHRIAGHLRLLSDRPLR